MVRRRGTVELLRAGPSSLPFSVSGWLERLADRLVLLYFSGTAVVGIYSVGYAIGERLLGSLVQAVLHGGLAQHPQSLARRRRGGRAEAIAEAQRMYIWITVGPVVFLIVFGRVLVRWITGPEFQQAAVVVPIIAASMWIGGYGAYINRQFESTSSSAASRASRWPGRSSTCILNIVFIPRYGMGGGGLRHADQPTFNAVVYFIVRDR